MTTLPISDKDFKEISGLLYENTGIFLPEQKKYLVVHRLMKRLLALNIDNFETYVEYLKENISSEMQSMIDNLTTNETFFFREEKHFQYLEELMISEFASRDVVRVWSAACSSGEEVYSIAMVLQETLRHNSWEIIGSDISDFVLNKARKGIYPIEEIAHIPEKFLKKYCRKGVRSKEGVFTINDKLRKSIHFYKINLYSGTPEIGPFEVIFLRNILIYFDTKTKKTVIRNILPLLKKNGFLIVSHTESIVDVTDELELYRERSSIYRKI